jgi:hypothetical protein
VRVTRVDELEGGDRGAHPRAGLAAVVELDALVQAVPERVDAEVAVGADVGGEHVDVVGTPRPDVSASVSFSDHG